MSKLDRLYDSRLHKLEVIARDGHVFEVDKIVFDGVPNSHKRITLRPTK